MNVFNHFAVRKCRFRSLPLPMVLFSVLCASELLAQRTENELLEKRFSDYRNTVFQEKLFVHLDRPFYLVGETIWFKIYVLDGVGHQLADMSKVAYVEVLDKENNPVVQTKILLEKGLGDGSILIPASMESGNYTFRGYTSWMKNFTPSLYFETPLTIVNTFRNLDPALVSKRSEEIDLQFFPEGGELVQGIESKVAFRASNSSGQGIDFSGFLLDQRNDTLVKFYPYKLGIGNFHFTPRQGSVYRALLRDSKGNFSSHSFPQIQEEGFTMRVADSTDNSIKITVSALIGGSATFPVYLLSHSRAGSPSAQVAYSKHGKAVFVVEKEKLGEGINHFTVFDSSLKAVSERLYFKYPSARLNIQEAVRQEQYGKREKVTVNLTTLTENSVPAQANLSLSVYLLDSLNSRSTLTIDDFLFLTSELKGTIESPELYTKSQGMEVAVDNLMLTHGWSRFGWKEVASSATFVPHNIPEYGGHFITGRVLNTSTGKPASSVSTFLAAPGKRPFLYTSLSDQQGRIRYEMKHFSGTKEIVVQTNTAVDSTFRFEIDDPFSSKFSFPEKHAFDISSQHAQMLVNRSISMQSVNSFMPKRYQAPVERETDSLGFYGIPSEKYILDDYTRFPTIEEVMREYVPGVQVRKRLGEFQFRVIDPRPFQKAVFLDEAPMLLLDGIPVFDLKKIMGYDPLKIKKLEVVGGVYYLGDSWLHGIVSFTTYKGDLGELEIDPRALVMQYDGVQNIREFYAPRYDLAAQVKSRVPDFRNLLHWVPDIATDSNGKRSVDFYTSDQEGVYRVVIQGITTSGVPGSTSFTVRVKGKSH